jgi:hypothetical protein
MFLGKMKFTQTGKTISHALKFYCVKCRKPRQVSGASEALGKRKNYKMRVALSKCETCGTKMFRILGKA